MNLWLRTRFRDSPGPLARSNSLRNVHPEKRLVPDTVDAPPRVYADDAEDVRPQEIPYSAEVRRKALHLIALIVPLCMALLGKPGALLLLIVASLLALAADHLRVRSEAFAAFIRTIFGSMMRREEIPPVGGPVYINGATWVLLSATLLAFVFPLRIAVPAFVTFMVCDAAAALVGRRFGRIHWPRSRRTVEGSLTFVLTGFVVMALFSAIAFWIAAISVVFAALAEAVPRPLNDNVRVPFVAALTIFLLERFVLGLDVPLFM